MQLSPQTQKVYEILIGKKDGLTVAEIAFKLRVAAADAYRLAKPLLDIGLIEKTNNRPAKLFAKPVENGLGPFLLGESRWFRGRFKPKTGGLFRRNVKPADMEFEFIQGRDELMAKSADEIDECSLSVDLLRSGHEIPPDTMRALVQAIGRGVKVRMLIQDFGDGNKEQVGNWIKNGILVGKTDTKYIRLMLYDTKIGYFMSYKHTESGQDVGMKIIYPAFTAILSQYFEDLWQKSEKILGD